MRITKKDYERLIQTSMEWCMHIWSEQLDRFEGNLPKERGIICWVDNYTAAILCREFLERRGNECHIAFDTSMDEYVFVTDYVPDWMKENA